MPRAIASWPYTARSPPPNRPAGHDSRPEPERMCGVSGIISSRAESLQSAISRMVCEMNHRGPDGDGTYLDTVSPARHLALGHNRLSIIDLSDQAAQPMRSAD